MLLICPRWSIFQATMDWERHGVSRQPDERILVPLHFDFQRYFVANAVSSMVSVRCGRQCIVRTRKAGRLGEGTYVIIKLNAKGLLPLFEFAINQEYFGPQFGPLRGTVWRCRPGGLIFDSVPNTTHDEYCMEHESVPYTSTHSLLPLNVILVQLIALMYHLRSVYWYRIVFVVCSYYMEEDSFAILLFSDLNVHHDPMYDV
jgi:hypothetical protein